MNTTVVQIVVKAPNCLLLRFTNFEIVDIDAVLVDLAAGFVARTHVNIAAAPSETLINEYFKVISPHLCRRKPQLMIFAIILLNPKLPSLNIVNDAFAMTVAALCLLRGVIV